MHSDRCKLCNQIALEGYEYCRDHYIENRKIEWLDNSDPNNLGFFKWVQYFFPHYVTYPKPKFHNDIILRVLSIYSPYKTNRFERQLNIKAYRGASKSTLLNMLWSEYILCNNGLTMKLYDYITDKVYEIKIDERFIVIATETRTQAEDFVVRIRDELKENKKIQYYYKIQIKKIKDDETGQWTRIAFKFNNCYLMGAGIGQQIRGKIKRTSRPTLIIVDEIYSENNTITADQRFKVKRWFDNAVHNTIDNQRGKIIVVGTVLHEDTIIMENEKSDMWINYSIPIINPTKFEELVKKHLIVNYAEREVILPYDDVKDLILKKKLQKEYFDKVSKEDDYQIAWQEKDDLHFIVLIFKNAVQKSNLASFYQEYLHILVANDEMRIKPEYIQEVNVLVDIRGHSTYIKLPHHTDYHYANVEIGIDFGTGTVDGDDSSIVVAAALDTAEFVVLKAISGKYGERDKRFYDRDFGKVELDLNKIEQIGIMDEALRLAKYYNASLIKVGYSGSEKSRIITLRQLAESSRMLNVNIVGRKQYGEGVKAERIFNSISTYYQSYRIYHNQNIPKLSYQLMFLGSIKEDDVADALECALYYISVPGKYERDPEKIDQPQFKREYKPLYNQIIEKYDSWQVP